MSIWNDLPCNSGRRLALTAVANGGRLAAEDNGDRFEHVDKL